MTYKQIRKISTIVFIFIIEFYLFTCFINENNEKYTIKIQIKIKAANKQWYKKYLQKYYISNILKYILNIRKISGLPNYLLPNILLIYYLITFFHMNFDNLCPVCMNKI